MDPQPDSMPNHSQLPAPAPGEPANAGSRREFLCRSARKLAYVAPVVLLFHPKQACASNGSTLTYWDELQQKAIQQGGGLLGGGMPTPGVMMNLPK